MLFRTDRGGRPAVWWQPADCSSPAQQLLALPGRDVWEARISPDGRWLLYRLGTLGSADGSADIYYRALSGDTTSHPIAATPFNELSHRLSPDGRWVAYTSDESRVHQVYVRPFARPGARVQVSVDGGKNPLWSRDGGTLYYISNRLSPRPSH